MKMKIEIIPSYKVAYLRHTGPYGSGNVQTMQNLKEWARANNLLTEKSVILGIAHDNPEITRPENCRYDTCIVVLGEHNLSDGVVSQGSIVGGNYAVFVIDHTPEAVQTAWFEIFPELQRHSCKFDTTRPVLERYLSEMVNNHYCEICVPVK